MQVSIIIPFILYFFIVIGIGVYTTRFRPEVYLNFFWVEGRWDASLLRCLL